MERGLLDALQSGALQSTPHVLGRHGLPSVKKARIMKRHGQLARHVTGLGGSLSLSFVRILRRQGSTQAELSSHEGDTLEQM